MYEKEISILGIQLLELAQMSAGWEEGSTPVRLNWDVRLCAPVSQMGSQASRKEEHRK